MLKDIQKKKKIPVIYKLFSCILSITSLFLLKSINVLNILSTKIFIIIILIILSIDLISILIMLKGRTKRIGLTISIILILTFGLLTLYINKTTGFLNELNLEHKTYNYSIIVLKSTRYKSLKDIKGLNIGYHNDGSKETNEALNKVLKKINLKSVGYENTNIMAKSLIEGEVDAILLENSYLDLLDENIEKDNNTFKNVVRKIYDFTILNNANDIIKDINVIKVPFNIYISGIDTYGEISDVSRSDVNMIVSVNPNTRQILLTSIPRDYYIYLHNKTGYKDKLTHAGLYGIDISIKTLEDLLDTEINYYAKVNFTSVIDIIDAIGGITVYSDYDFTSRDNYNYNKGYNNLNGEEALSFARERKAFTLGDRQRVKNQQAVFKAIFDKCTSKKIITKYNKLLDSLQESFVTNMPTDRITSLIKLQLTKNYSWNIITNSLEGTDGSNYTYSSPMYKSYVMIPDNNSVIYSKKLINNIMNGNKISEDQPNIQVSNTDNKYTDIKIENFTVKLVRNTITFKEGEEYIYHGYIAVYNGKDVTKNNEIEEEFIVNDKKFNNYRDLVHYITYNLRNGNHKVTYNIKKSTFVSTFFIW